MGMLLGNSAGMQTSQPPADTLPDLICFSHLRWNFVFQRPQHLLTRCARERRVFYVEEPIFDAVEAPRLKTERSGSVTVVVPHLPAGLSEEACHSAQRALLTLLIEQEHVSRYVLWYY